MIIGKESKIEYIISVNPLVWAINLALASKTSSINYRFYG